MDPSEYIEELLEAYLRNELSGNDLEEFNSYLEKDKAFAEEVKKMVELNKVLEEDDWSLTEFDVDNKQAKEYFNFYTDEKNKSYYKKLESISASNGNKTNYLRSIFGAVGIAALIVIGFFVYNNLGKVDSNEVYATYMNTDDLPSLTNRGSVEGMDSILNLIDYNFQTKSYTEVTNLIDYHSNQFSTSYLDLVTLYKGVSLLKLEKYKQAYEAFSNETVFDNSHYAQIADWYKGLTLLKENEVEKAKVIFVEIVKDKKHIKYKEAKKLLKKLK